MQCNEKTGGVVSHIKCQKCMSRLCKKHPLQDHGEREASIKSKASGASAGTKAMNARVKAQIERLEAEKAEDVDEAKQMEYRLRMEIDRDKATKKKQKKLSSEEQNLALNSSLNPATLRLLMQGDDSDDGDSGSENSSGDSSDSESIGDSRSDKRREKKAAKKERKKEKKERKKEKKREKKERKREKKEKKNEKKRTRSSSSSDEDSS